MFMRRTIDAGPISFEHYYWKPKEFLWQALTWSMLLSGYFAQAAIAEGGALAFSAWLLFPRSVDFHVSFLHLSVWTLFTLYMAIFNLRVDFEAFQALGPSGTPSTLAGFKRVTLLSWFVATDVLKPPEHAEGRGLLKDIPERDGVRPIVRGIAPQRQINQRSSRSMSDRLIASMNNIVTKDKGCLRLDQSFLEKSTLAIFAQDDCVAVPAIRIYCGEVAHPHRIDGSVHVILHPADIALVITKGRGERHPLAGANRWCRWWLETFEGRTPVPAYLTLLYGPRTPEEVHVVGRIIEAGVKFVCGLEALRGGIY